MRTAPRPEPAQGLCATVSAAVSVGGRDEGHCRGRAAEVILQDDPELPAAIPFQARELATGVKAASCRSEDAKVVGRPKSEPHETESVGRRLATPATPCMRSTEQRPTPLGHRMTEFGQPSAQRLTRSVRRSWAVRSLFLTYRCGEPACLFRNAASGPVSGLGVMSGDSGS